MILSITIVSGSVATNVIQNGDFEIWENINQAQAWYASAGVSGALQAEQESSVVHSGFYSCQLNISQNTDGYYTARNGTSGEFSVVEEVDYHFLVHFYGRNFFCNLKLSTL